jgi:DNA-binding response OmpR family regulator
MTKTRILYVEDEPFLGRIVKESLESRDFEVTMVTDGKDAVAAYRQSMSDICVLDVMLPTRDGFTLAQDIRQLNATIPIIFVTAKTQTEDLLKGFSVGGNDYLRKPFSMEELIVRVQNLLQLTRKLVTATPEDVSIGKYMFIPMRYELRLADGVKKLSHREASLLQLLCEHKNVTLSRKDILLKLWGDDSFFNSRNLDVYITKLRDHLRQDPAVEIITIKGVGYRFVDGD